MCLAKATSFSGLGIEQSFHESILNNPQFGLGPAPFPHRGSFFSPSKFLSECTYTGAVPLSPAVQLPSQESCASPVLASMMTQEEIIKLLHHDNSALPSGCPCNTANTSNTKTHWSPKELHCTMGCRKFKNYKSLLQVSCDGE
jgi:hypothetical protein